MITITERAVPKLKELRAELEQKRGASTEGLSGFRVVHRGFG
jgi:hypothetical protein